MIPHLDTTIMPYAAEIKINDQNALGASRVKLSQVLVGAKFNLYLMDINSCITIANDNTAETMGFDSPESTVGKSIFNISDDSSAYIIRKNDLSVLKNQQTEIIEEDLLRLDEKIFQILSIKSPLYNDENKLIGIFGCSIALGIHSLSSSLSYIRHLAYYKIFNRIQT